MVWWLKLHASTAGGMGLIPGWELETHRPCYGHCQKRKLFDNNEVLAGISGIIKEN